MADSGNIAWIIDDDPSIRWVLERALRAGGIATQSFAAGEAALELLEREKPDVLLTDIRLPGIGGLSVLERVHALVPQLPVVVMTAQSDLSSTLRAYKSGVFDYLPKPFEIDKAVELIRHAIQSRHSRHSQPTARPTVSGLIGCAPAMQLVFRAIGRLARSSVTVLITGESGTGKELVARSLHLHSPRASGPFVALNTAAIPAEPLESELFGHEKGAFTGAASQRCGRFEQAHGGTLFLDEIGDMSAALQTRLLRVLAENSFYRVGGQSPICTDVRVIAATHQDLYERVQMGLFREDLYYRLNVIRIELPPLRARIEDLGELLDHYCGMAARELDIPPKTFSRAALGKLGAYGWPGNIRELVNLCQRLSLLVVGSEVQVEDLPAYILDARQPVKIETEWTRALARWADRERIDKPLIDQAQPLFERTLIRCALRMSSGHRQDAARLIGWGRNTLTRKLKELGMEGAHMAE